MADIRSVGLTLKDPDDDEAFQLLVSDVQRLKQELRKGSNAGYGGAPIGGPSVNQSSVEITGGSITNVTIESPTINNATFSPPLSSDIDGVWAYNSASAGITGPVPFDTTSYDPNGWFVSPYVFQPTVAGVYFVIASITAVVSPSSSARIRLNGSSSSTISIFNGGNIASINQSGSVHGILTLNGTSDQVYIDAGNLVGTVTISPGSSFTALLLVRS